ncbi:MAG TPA: stage II sporulation protein M [Pirellulaceae bacterium]|nr:stage II sporulation protein M [Pirellulaceae bacterium]
MKVVELLERRRKNWHELEMMCDGMQGGARPYHPGAVAGRVPGVMAGTAAVNAVQMVQANTTVLPAEQISRFGALYRAACADLALAYAYQLPQNTVAYLHRLVGRAHNQLYRSRRFEFRKWGEMLLFDVPKMIFNDRCVQAMFVVFWGLFILCAFLGYSKTAWPDFAEQVLGPEFIQQLEEMYKNPIDGSLRGGDENMMMAGMYIQHNTSIGLQCFAWGLLVVPGLLMTMSNAIQLGTAFGYMARPDVPEGENFFHFVTAHGPFELTAIVLSAGAGLRLGLSWMITGGLSRGAALIQAGRQVIPVVGAAAAMFFMAALIEGFLSPSGAPYWLKVFVAILSSSLLAFYFVVLGFPRGITMPTHGRHPLDDAPEAWRKEPSTEETRTKE